MVVDFAFKKVPNLRVASLRWKGAYSEATIRRRFEEVERWAKSRGLRTGRWIFREPGSRTWEVSIEVRGAAKSEGPVRVRALPAATVASVVFDPDVVSPRVVYHGLSDWLRWRRKEKKVRSVVESREVYSGNPWKDRHAWSATDVQFVVRR
ncbi:MAG TPA: GyrI-like domain-containing protein [Thermoplasmata archaeon]|nr:GyrI-like domain-containing protein [Thermoplasmata archaeon]